MEFFPNSWLHILAVETPLFELIGRGTVIYFIVLVFMRLMPRIGGQLAVMDLVFVLLIAEAATHALGEYTTIGDAIFVIATLMVWNYLLNLLSFHVPFIERVVSGSPLQVVRDGRLMRSKCGGSFLQRKNSWHSCAGRALKKSKM